MLRMILTMVLPLLAPTIVFYIILRLRAKWRKEDEDATDVPAYHTWPWIRLVAAGAVLLIVTFVFTGLPTGENYEGEYVPPHMENGELVPGQFVKEMPAE